MASVAPDGSSASPRKVRLCALCRFATCFDKLLMAAGLFCAFLSGGVQCAMLIAFSGSLEALGECFRHLCDFINFNRLFVLLGLRIVVLSSLVSHTLSPSLSCFIQRLPVN